MIIDFLTQHSNIVKCSYYDSISNNVITNEYSTKSFAELMSWRLTSNTVSSVDFTFISNDTKILKEIELEVAGGLSNAAIQTTIKTSLDYINWDEYRYLYDKTTYDIKPEIFYKIDNNNFVNINTNETVSANENFRYIFKKINSFSGATEYINPTFEFKYIRITLSNLIAASATPSNPIYLYKLKVNIDESLNYDAIDTGLLELRSDMYTQSKMYEEYSFFPSIITNFLQMIEDENPAPNNLLTDKIDIQILDL